MTSFVYRIRNKKTGEFSTGSANPKFNKLGKTWRNRQALGNHLSLMSELGAATETYMPLDDIEIVEYELVEKQTYSIKEVEIADRYYKNKKLKAQYVK